MKKTIYSLTMFAMLVSMAACSSDDPEDNSPCNKNEQCNPENETGPETCTVAYIMSEGNPFSNESGALTKFNPVEKTVTAEKYFKSVNNVDLGVGPNAMTLYNGKIYLVNSGKDQYSDNGGLWVIDPATCKATTSAMIQFSDPKDPTHKAMPRQMAFYDGKLYISLYSGAVIAVSLDDPKTIVGSKILDATFSEGICVANDMVYVCNSGKSGDTMAGQGNTISYFSINDMDGTNKNVSTMTSALNPKLIKYSDETGRFYYNSLGNWTSAPLHYFTDPNAGYNTIEGVNASDFDLTCNDIYTIYMDWTEYESQMARVSLADHKVHEYDLSDVAICGYTIKLHKGLLYVGGSSAPYMYVFDKETGEFLYNVNTKVYNTSAIVFAN